MKFSQKFLIFIFLVFALMISVNIVSLKFFTLRYFDQYITTIKQNSPNIEFDVLQKIISDPALDEETLKEYQQLTKDLSNVTSSLEKFSETPESYTPKVIETLKKIGIPSTSIDQLLFVNSVQSFFMNVFNFSMLQ
jgi:cell division protein FtsL